MKRQKYFKNTLIAAIVILITTLAPSCDENNLQKSQLSEEELKAVLARSEVIFKDYCSGCHGGSIEAFADETWDYGNSSEAIYESIKNGRQEGEMPGFEETLSETQIREMIISILHASDKLEEAADIQIAEESGKFSSEDLVYRLETVADGFNSPWSIAFLPDGDMLVADKSGELWRVGKLGTKTKIGGVPEVLYERQGGLMDIEFHPDFENNSLIYLSYSIFKPEDDDLSTTAVARYKLENNQLTNGEIIFEALPYRDSGRHYGSRLEFDNEGFIYITVGDRGERDVHPQVLTDHLGKVHRIHDDGRIPDDNPFVVTPGAVKSIYSYGHRNQQGMIRHPGTGEIWTHEHGPKGGDEINIIGKGLNYGWPVISYGINYIGTKFTDLTEKEGMEQPLHYWDPSIAPCGMDFVRGDIYPGWTGHLLVGSLKFEFLGLYKLDGEKVISEERLMEDVGRVRSVRQGPDGYIYVGIEDPGVVYRIVPVN